MNPKMIWGMIGSFSEQALLGAVLMMVAHGYIPAWFDNQQHLLEVCALAMGFNVFKKKRENRQRFYGKEAGKP